MFYLVYGDYGLMQGEIDTLLSAHPNHTPYRISGENAIQTAIAELSSNSLFAEDNYIYVISDIIDAKIDESAQLTQIITKKLDNKNDDTIAIVVSPAPNTDNKLTQVLLTKGKSVYCKPFDNKNIGEYKNWLAKLFNVDIDLANYIHEKIGVDTALAKNYATVCALYTTEKLTKKIIDKVISNSAETEGSAIFDALIKKDLATAATLTTRFLASAQPVELISTLYTLFRRHIVIMTTYELYPKTYMAELGNINKLSDNSLFRYMPTDYVIKKNHVGANKLSTNALVNVPQILLDAEHRIKQGYEPTTTLLNAYYKIAG